MVLQEEIKSLVEKLSLIHFLIALALLDLALKLDEVNSPLHKVSVHQSPLLKVIFLILIL